MDEIQFKIRAAERFLAKIPNTIPKNPRQIEKLEEDSEAFLFFAASVIELAKRQINDKFEIFDRKNVFYIHGLRKSLAASGTQGMTKATIASYFSSPKNTKSKTDVSKSGLWILQALRNQAMHGRIIQVQGRFLVFSYTNHKDKTALEFAQKTQNPHKYFAQIMAQLKKFLAQICKILTKS